MSMESSELYQKIQMFFFGQIDVLPASWANYRIKRSSLGHKPIGATQLWGKLKCYSGALAAAFLYQPTSSFNAEWLSHQKSLQQIAIN